MYSNEEQKELKYFEKVKDFLCKETERLKNLIVDYKANVKSQGEKFNEDNPNGGMYADMELTELHYEMESKLQEIENSKYDIYFYEKLRKSPYFARVDFTPDKTGKKQEVYIGLKTLQDSETYNTLVCDWRAPISSLFYDDFGDDKAYFKAPSGEMYGNLTLKRQYKFENGELKSFFDSDVKIDDDILREVLSENTQEHLRVIVNSIQREQNKAIRFSDNKNLIVYGPAGSGKTSVGFHRIAYLLYQNRKELISSEIVMFSNNDIFSSYVADIIPELGEMPINYASFYTIFRAEFPEFNVPDYYNLADELILGNSERKASIDVKYDEKFIEYLTSNAKNYLPSFKNVEFLGKQILSEKDISNRFESDTESSPSVRADRLVSFVNSNIDEYFRVNEEEIFAQLDEQSALDEDTDKIFKMKRRELKHNTSGTIRSVILADPVMIYLEILKKYISFTNGNTKIYETVKNNAEKNVLNFEDALSALLVKCVMGDSAVLNSVKHVLIDEAQDLGLLQHKIILTMFPKAKYTLLMDTNQAINPEINSTEIEKLSNLYNAKTLYLNRSYRSTKEINEFAISLLPKEKSYDIFNRNGEKVNFKKGEVELIKTIEEYKKKSSSVAIIVKNLKKSQELHKELFKNFPEIRLCDNKSCTLSDAPVVMPLTLTKGLEFDSVIVVDDGGFKGEENKKYLYMAATRALHRLSIIEVD